MSVFATVLGLLIGSCPFVVFVIAMIGLVWMSQSSARQRRQALADELGLARTAGRLEGEIDGLSVVAYTESRGGKNKTTYAVVEVGLPELTPDVAVVGRLGRSAKQDIDIGDPSFDHAYRIDVSGLGLAWLSAARRQAMRRHGLILKRGKVVTDLRGSLRAEQVRSTVEGAKALRMTDPVAELRAIAAEDPSLRMRARAIDALLDQPDRVTLDELETWEHHEGLPGLLATARLGRAFDRRLRELEDKDRHLLGDHLSRHGAPDRIVELIDVLGPSTPRPVWFMATEAAANHGSTEARDAIVRALGRFGDASFFADRAAHALVRGGPEVQGALVDLLPRLDQSLPEALGWLEEHGEVSAVAALDRMLAESWPMSETRERAQRAKRAIQGRASGARGGLALATDAAAGALSEAQSVAGRLSAVQKAGS
ncbi:MAG: hypothetical protein KC621_08335 [Myxococcales bacterium]|nr:hypothetical protein [Myxococcales bacterium]